jgi:hypothetical protein
LPRKLRYKLAALRDLAAVFQWLSQPGSGIRLAIDGLTEHPCRHPFGPHSGGRELPCEGYRVVYRVNAGYRG